MRPIAADRAAFTAVADTQAKFGLDADSTAHLIDLLTAPYSDVRLAVVRELSTNARDAQLAAGVDAPIQVTIADGQLQVSDLGVGLSQDDLINVYSRYGASTKRDSDEFNGLLGIGAKVPLAYADSYTVESVKDGVKTLVSVGKDADGVGVLTVLASLETDEPSGTTITVPLNGSWGEAAEFTGTAHRLFRFWEPGTVELNGEAPTYVGDVSEAGIWISEDVLVLPTNSVNTRNYGSGSYIVQGGVAYPVNNALGWSYNVPGQVIAFVPNGTVSFVPSREELRTIDRNIEVVKELALFVQERLEKALIARIGEATTLPERWAVYGPWRRDFRLNAPLRGVLGIGGKNTLTRGWALERGTARRTSTWSPIDTLEALSSGKAERVITGFPFGSLSDVHRFRLGEFDPECRKWNVLPIDPSGVAAACGQATWDEVVAATEDAVAKRRAASRTPGGKRSETTYASRIGLDAPSVLTLDQLVAAVEALDAEVGTVVDIVWADGGVVPAAQTGVTPYVAISCRSASRARIVKRLGDTRRYFIGEHAACITWADDFVAAWVRSGELASVARSVATSGGAIAQLQRALGGLSSKVLDPELVAIVTAPKTEALEAYTKISPDVRRRISYTAEWEAAIGNQRDAQQAQKEFLKANYPLSVDFNTAVDPTHLLHYLNTSYASSERFVR